MNSTNVRGFGSWLTWQMRGQQPAGSQFPNFQYARATRKNNGQRVMVQFAQNLFGVKENGSHSIGVDLDAPYGGFSLPFLVFAKTGENFAGLLLRKKHGESSLLVVAGDGIGVRTAASKHLAQGVEVSEAGHVGWHHEVPFAKLVPVISAFHSST
jgi:hypothetical protein